MIDDDNVWWVPGSEVEFSAASLEAAGAPVVKRRAAPRPDPVRIRPDPDGIDDAPRYGAPELPGLSEQMGDPES